MRSMSDKSLIFDEIVDDDGDKKRKTTIRYDSKNGGPKDYIGLVNINE